MTSRLARWVVAFAAFLAVTAAAFVPVLLLLAETPLHDGDELPGRLLLDASLVASGGIGVLAAWLLHRRLAG